MRKLMTCLLGLIGFVAAQNPNTAKFPASLAGDEDLLVGRNRAESYLTAAIDATTLTIAVADGTQFLNFMVITIENERILVCSVSGNTLTVCPGGRGFDGSTAASHPEGAWVAARVVAWHHNQLAAETKAIQNALGVNLGNVVTIGTAQTITGQKTFSADVGIGIATPNAKLHVATSNAISPSLTWGATAGQIFRNEAAEIAVGLSSTNPWPLWLQGRHSGDIPWNLVLQPLGGHVGIGTMAPEAMLHVEGRTQMLEAKWGAGTQGTCDASNRGRVVMVQGGTGIRDAFRICEKDASDNYAWRGLDEAGGLPDMSGQANKVLSNDGSAASWRAVTSGATGALSVSHSSSEITLDIVTDVVPQKSAANTFTGLNTFDLGVQLTPMSTPSSPSNGRMWYDSGTNTFRCRQNGTTYDCIGGGLPDPGANGMVARTAANQTAARTIAGTANEITVTNGDGVSGNPTLALGANFDISGKTSTKPVKTGTTPPSSCGVGELFFDTDATAGLNLAACTSTDTWTVQGVPNISDSHSWWISQEWTLGSGQTSTANTVYLYLKQLTIPQTFEKGSIYVDTAYSGGRARVGVYSVSGGACGTLLFQTPNLDTSSTGLKTGAFTPVKLSPGWYYMAIALDNSTAAVRGNPAGTSMNTLRNAGSMKYMGTATNSVSDWGNVGLPSSCGGMTGVNTHERAMLFHR